MAAAARIYRRMDRQLLMQRLRVWEILYSYVRVQSQKGEGVGFNSQFRGLDTKVNCTHVSHGASHAAARD